MSLQNPATINQAATAFAQLWTTWLRPPGVVAHPGGGVIGANARAMPRKNSIRTAITQFSGFLPPVTIAFSNLGPGVVGGLDWTRWELSINDLWFTQDGITYNDFLELCATAYHETRHAEQVYRAAQGLALGLPNGFAPPDTTSASLINLGSSTGGGVAAKVAAFSGGATTNPVVRQQLVKKLLNVPVAVAQHADTNRAAFSNFTGLARPAWFKRNTVRLEVEEWMRSIAKQTLFGMTMWVEVNAGATSTTYGMYRNLPVEIDAHGIEDLVINRVEAIVGLPRAAHGAQPRTNIGLFGA